MAITFPLPLPDGVVWKATNFKNIVPALSQPLKSGEVFTLRIDQPYWEAAYTSVIQTLDELAAAEAWYMLNEGGTKSFLGHDQKRPFPAAYPDGFDGMVIAGTSTPFTGALTVTGYPTDYTIGLSGAPDSFVLTIGDNIGLVEGSKFGLFKVAETMMFDGNGDGNVIVRPFVPTNVFSPLAAANVASPVCEFIMVKNSWSAPANGEFGTISFKARQRVF